MAARFLRLRSSFNAPAAPSCSRWLWKTSLTTKSRPAAALRSLSSSSVQKGASRGLEERLAAGEHILCAEGYLVALARQGYIAHGVWVPEFILEQPEVLRNVHYEFVHAGTDITEAFQYYTHREKMRQIGREQDLERINRIALRIAREVADDTDTLMAGGISNTNIYVENSPEVEERIRAMFEEQVRWSKEEGADYIIAETISYLREAEIALEVIQSFNLPAVVTMSIPTPDLKHPDGKLRTLDGVPLAKAFQTLIDKGATVTGPNCARGPEQMLEIVEDVINDGVRPEKICALPVMFRTTKEEQTFFELTDKCCPDNNPAYPHGMDAFYVSVVEVTNFTKRCKELGLKYMGLCCGNNGNYTRAMAEALGRRPPASRYHDPTNEGIDPIKRKRELEEKLK